MVVDPHAAVLAVLAGPAASVLSKPKPEGGVQLCERGVCGVAVPIAGQSDTVTPMFGVPLQHVRLDDGVQLRVSLTDKRWFGFSSVPIGTVDLTANDLLAALNQGGGHVYDVRVDNQGTQQILFVGVSVIREQ